MPKVVDITLIPKRPSPGTITRPFWLPCLRKARAYINNREPAGYNYYISLESGHDLPGVKCDDSCKPCKTFEFVLQHMHDHDVLNVETSETTYPCKPGGFLRIEKFIHIRAVKRFESPECIGCETLATVDCIDQRVFLGVAVSPFTGEASTSARDIHWSGKSTYDMI